MNNSAIKKPGKNQAIILVSSKEGGENIPGSALPGPGIGIPFRADGEIIQYVSARQLARYVPRTPKTLIQWAEKGVIPGIRRPSLARNGRPSWIFDLIAVHRALRTYRP